MKNYMLLSIILVIMVFGQIMTKMGSVQDNLLNFYVLLGYSALILRGILWTLTLKENPISIAYPFLSLSFVLVLGASHYLFGEPISPGKLVGSLLIILGVTLISRNKVREEDRYEQL